MFRKFKCLWPGPTTFIDIILLAAVATSALHLCWQGTPIHLISEGEPQMLVTIGTPVQDLEIIEKEPPLAAKSGPAKVPCRIQRTWGGGGVFIPRAIAALRAHVMPVMMIGSDEAGEKASAALGQEFSPLKCVPCLAETRLSVLTPDGRMFTVLAQRNSPLLSAALVAELKSAAAVLIAPLPASECRLVAELLRVACRSIWLPSVDQLRDVAATIALANGADWTVMNDSEGKLLTGEDQPEDIIQALRGEGLRGGVIITSRLGALAWTPKVGYSFAPAIAGGKVVRTVGGGDTFVGTFSAVLCQSGTLQNALAAGQYAAGRHVRGLHSLPTAEALAVWGKTQSKVNLAANRRVRRLSGGWKLAGASAATAAGLSAAAAVLLTILGG